MKVTYLSVKYEAYWDYMEVDTKYFCPKCGEVSTSKLHQRFSPSYRLHSNPSDRPENEPFSYYGYRKRLETVLGKER